MLPPHTASFFTTTVKPAPRRTQTLLSPLIPSFPPPHPSTFPTSPPLHESTSTAAPSRAFFSTSATCICACTFKGVALPCCPTGSICICIATGGAVPLTLFVFVLPQVGHAEEQTALQTRSRWQLRVAATRFSSLRTRVAWNRWFSRWHRGRASLVSWGQQAPSRCHFDIDLYSERSCTTPSLLCDCYVIAT